MVKSLLSAAVAIFAAACVFTSSAHATTPPDSCFGFDAGSGTITAYYENEFDNAANPACPRDVDIPSTIGGVSVTTIGSAIECSDGFCIARYAFTEAGLTSVTIPASVTTIERRTFEGNSLDTVVIPSSVTTIGSFAFANNNLTSVVIEDGVAELGYFSFSENELTSVSIPGSVTVIDNGAFAYNQLTDITIADGVQSIGRDTGDDGSIGAFMYNRLTTVDIPDSVEYIGADSFRSNDITTLHLGSGVEVLDHHAFIGNNLTIVSIPAAVHTIGHGAFSLQSSHGADLISEDGLDHPDTSVAQAAYDTIRYAQLILEDQTNPHGLADFVFFDSDDDADFDNDGNTDDGVSYGGHLINATGLRLQYRTVTHQSLRAEVVLTGQAEGRSLMNYLVGAGPVIPDPAIMWDPTPAERAAIDEAVSAYYRIGDSIDWTAPAIDGYQLPNPSSGTVVLGAGTNVLDLVYAPSQQSSTELEDPAELADTGTSVLYFAGLSAVLFVTGSWLIGWQMYRARA